ncbi:MAG: HAD-IB family hydrolase [Myxococcales bacterium]|nr:HAD-IB family hydrolase [Myxococcales bacterium]
MSDLERALQAVELAPDGPSVAAFLDLDGTVVTGITALAYLKADLERLGAEALYALANDIRSFEGQPDGDVKTIARAAQLLSGRTEQDVQALCDQVFRKSVAASLRPGARELVRAHRRKGHTVALATAASRFQARPVARDLDIEHLLATEVEVRDGRLTGRLEGLPCWGQRKAAAVRHFAAAHGVDLAVSFAYANGDEDRAFLASVGRPGVVCADEGLAAVAASEGWPAYRIDDPPAATLRGVVGTLVSMSTFNTAMIAAVAGQLISGGRWKAIGPTLATAAELSLRVAGVDVRVTGREHLESARPAVFVINHQSNLDPVVAGTLIRHDFTGVGKQEVASDPRAFAMGWLGVALIDRSDSESARASVSALVDRIRAGESVAIWPEGTRMPTQRLGPFKKGAFHLAMDAGVPLVPIVLRNTGELLPRGQTVVRPGTVDAAVLPPVPTTGWTKASLDGHVARVREQFERTLAHWPGPTS